MSTFVFGSSLSYADYLQARSFEKSVANEIRAQTRSLIASNEQLVREHISLTAGLTEGFERLAFDVEAGLTELNATFEWGISKILIELGKTNDSLAKLVKAAKTPAQTWACEQFEIARDAFRRELYPEALESLNRAINGYAGNTGYRLDHRFHFLLGTIRMGSYTNWSPEILDLAEAENAFLLAAKYAGGAEPRESGHAFLAAGWAAYCQGNIEAAILHTKQAIGMVPLCGEAFYQLAKIFAHVRKCDECLAQLCEAVALDRNYILRAGSDGDFKRIDADLNQFLSKLCDGARARADELILKTRRRLAGASREKIEEYPLVTLCSLDGVERELSKAEASIQTGTYFSLLDASAACQKADRLIDEALTRFPHEVKDRVNNQRGRVWRQRQELIDLKGMYWLKGSFCIFIFVALTFSSGFASDLLRKDVSIPGLEFALFVSTSLYVVGRIYRFTKVAEMTKQIAKLDGIYADLEARCAKSVSP